MHGLRNHLSLILATMMASLILLLGFNTPMSFVSWIIAAALIAIAIHYHRKHDIEEAHTVLTDTVTEMQTKLKATEHRVEQVAKALPGLSTIPQLRVGK